MHAADWLHACGPRVYLFDWFNCISDCYAATTDVHAFQPPLHHFLRQSCYFSNSAGGSSSKKRAKRQKVEVNAAPWLMSCAQAVRRAVADVWHRPKMSWFAQEPPISSVQVEWPNFVGRFDSASLLASGQWQPFLQATMENASDQCSTLAIGDDQFVIPPCSAFRSDRCVRLLVQKGRSRSHTAALDAGWMTLHVCTLLMPRPAVPKHPFSLSILLGKIDRRSAAQRTAA